MRAWGGSVALVLGALWYCSALEAQSIVVLDAICPPMEAPISRTWVSTPVDPCPGRSLLMHCGGAPATGCPSLTDALSAVSIETCTPDLALFGVAELLALEGPYDVAAQLYRVHFASPSLAIVARLRAAHLAYRLSEYRTAVDLLADVLSRPMPPRSRDIAIDLYSAILTYEDFDENGIPDPESYARALEPAWLPERDFASDVALVALQRLGESYRYEWILESAVTFRARFGSAHVAAIDRLEVDALGGLRRFDAMVPVALAAAAGCRSRGEDCEGSFLDTLVELAASQLRACGRAPTDSPFDVHLSTCLSGVEIAQRVIAVRPDPALAADAIDALAWARPWVAERTRPRARGRAVRTAFVPPAPPPAVRVAPAVTTEVEPTLRMPYPYRIEAVDLSSCIPPHGAVLDVTFRAGTDRAWTVAASPRGRTARCIEDALSPHLSILGLDLGDESGVIHAHVWLVAE